ncbi:hypothetical protein LSH36_1380g00014 [Paralvinella palmiformis]|uniref:Uncharacterized protein n=1 Tax=Paralvinella palmiformis TaxID=53620 RepID=A0AAD9MQG6_9ANNE|nr:hypothetical protein LSH36_1380g00014 [Paralvinella palmiformis]
MKISKVYTILLGLTVLVLIIPWYLKRTNPINQLHVVDCNPGVGCEYPEEVDLRVIVMTYNRAASLGKLLQSLESLELDGNTASLEIWIDRKAGKKNGKRDTDSEDTVHTETLKTAQGFSWSRGQTRVHVQKRHVGIYGQWIDTWRPRPGTNELALFLEDDLSVSPYAYRWLRAVHEKYGSRNDIAGYTLQGEGVANANNRRPINRPKIETVFLFKLLGSWGYAPHPKSWMNFQDWYHDVKRDANFHPYVPKATTITGWYQMFERQNRQDTMWTMWHVYYCEKYNMFTVFANIQAVTKNSNIILAANRNEPGLHQGHKGPERTNKILKSWSDDYVRLPDVPVRYDWDGSVLTV